jgi:SepF-like predicted cell division protein (DUF552 family)
VSHQHGVSGKFNYWETLIPTIRGVFEGELLPVDLAMLDKQDKELQMIIDELKAIQQKHRTNARLCRKSEKFTGVVGVVV